MDRRKWLVVGFILSTALLLYGFIAEARGDMVVQKSTWVCKQRSMIEGLQILATMAQEDESFEPVFVQGFAERRRAGDCKFLTPGTKWVRHDTTEFVPVKVEGDAEAWWMPFSSLKLSKGESE